MPRNKSRGKQQRSQDTYESRMTQVPRIPTIQTNPIIRHTYRYTAASGGQNIRITGESLRNAAGAICTVVNSNLTGIAQACRLKRIRIWGPVVAASPIVPVTVSVRWMGAQGVQGLFSDAAEPSDTSVNPMVPAYLDVVPPRGTDASMWFKSVPSGAVRDLLTIGCPAGSIVDVTAEWVLADGQFGDGYAVSTGVLGTMYFPPLDGSTDLLFPTLMTSTT